MINFPRSHNRILWSQSRDQLYCQKKIYRQQLIDNGSLPWSSGHAPCHGHHRGLFYRFLALWYVWTRFSTTILLNSKVSLYRIGYDNGVFSGLTTDELFLETMGNPNTTLLGFIVAVYELGCLVGALASMFWGEALGRRLLTVAGAVWLILGTIIQCTSYGQAQMIVGRVVTGFGMGCITSAVPIWQCETTPAHLRGRTMAIELSCLIVGIVIAYWIDYGCSLYSGAMQWRFPIAFQIIFAIFLIIMCFFLPGKIHFPSRFVLFWRQFLTVIWHTESPRWLASHKREQEALEIVCLLRDGTPEDENIRDEMNEIKDAIALEEEEAGSWKDCFRDGGVMGWQRVAIACSAQALQEFTGTNIITYYAPYVMVNSVGLTSHQSLLLSGGLQLWFLVASILPWYVLSSLFLQVDLKIWLTNICTGFSSIKSDVANSFSSAVLVWVLACWFPAWQSELEAITMVSALLLYCTCSR